MLILLTLLTSVYEYVQQADTFLSAFVLIFSAVHMINYSTLDCEWQTTVDGTGHHSKTKKSIFGKWLIVSLSSISTHHIILLSFPLWSTRNPAIRNVTFCFAEVTVPLSLSWQACRQQTTRIHIHTYTHSVTAITNWWLIFHSAAGI